MRQKIKLGGETAKRQVLLAGLLLLLLLLCAVRVPDQFYTAYNFQSMAFQMPELGLISLGMLLIVITGGIDLSITYTSALCGVTCALVLKALAPEGAAGGGVLLLAVLTALATALLCGAFNGFFIAVLGVHPWLVTLGTMSLFEGVCIILTGGGSISGLPEDFYARIGNATVLGVPLIMLILILATAALGVLLHRTAWGRRLMMTGSDELAARFSGVRVRRIKFEAYLLGSFLAGVSGVIMASRYNSAKVDHGEPYLMQSIAIIVLSGADINGGSADIFSMALTMLLLQILNTGSSMLGADRYTVTILNGVILIGVLLLNALMERRTKRREIQHMKKG